MKTLYLTAAALVLLSAQAANAQPYRNFNPASGYGPYSRPGLSPYLNLIRGGDPAANYYMGVVPERDRRATGLQFGAQLQDLEQRISTPSGGDRDSQAIPELPGTGHGTTFLNYGSYFNFGGPARGTLASPLPASAQRRTR